MLPGQQHVTRLGQRGERRITRFPRRPFKAGAGLHRHPNDLQRNAQRIADRLTMLRPRISRRLEAVMDMDGAQRRQGMVLGEIGKQMQQDGGVETAGESDTPMSGVAPRLKAQHKPRRQITLRRIHRDGSLHKEPCRSCRRLRSFDLDTAKSKDRSLRQLLQGYFRRLRDRSSSVDHNGA
ncbi:hypothetical protein EMIT0215P_20185 [Pseudomonas serboccidentalis]